MLSRFTEHWFITIALNACSGKDTSPASTDSEIVQFQGTGCVEYSNTLYNNNNNNDANHNHY